MMVFRLPPWQALFCLAVFLVAGCAARADGQPPALRLPLDCRLGETCWVMNLPDTDTGPAARDFRCLAQTYDGHSGTDFAILDRKRMAEGVPVLAAAAGTVVQTRDGEADGGWTQTPGRGGRECGNRVAIDHGGGWVTDYCHLRNGSVRVKPGQQVTAGQPLALVGLSGNTEYPHVHLGLLRFPPGQSTGIPTDPFTGQPLTAPCGGGGPAAWSPSIDPQAASGIFAAGFAPAAPTPAEIQRDADSHLTLPAQKAGPVFWVAAFALREGDVLEFRLIDATGQEVARAEMRSTRSPAFSLASMPLPSSLTPGRYQGLATHLRAGLPPRTIAKDVELR